MNYKRSIGNNSPLKIDVWFVSKVVSTDYKWGVQLQVKDNTHQLIVPVGAYGSILLRIKDPASFVLQVVGKKKKLSKDELKEFLMPSIESGLKEYIAENIKAGSLDVFSIETVLSKASNILKDSLKITFEKFGLNVIDFFIQGMEVIGSNPEYLKIKESLADAASLKIRAKAASEAEGYYKKERNLESFNQKIEKKISNPIKTKSNNFEKEKKTTDLKSKLQYLRELLDSGLITKEEYDKKRLSLLDQI